MTAHPPLPDSIPPAGPTLAEKTVTLVTGLEGAVDLAEPVTCGYCHHGIVSNDDHVVDCCWRPGKSAAR